MPNGNTEPADPHYARDNSVRYLASRSVIGKFQAQASFDDGEGQDKTAPPDMESRPNRFSLFSDVDGMVKSAESGLEKESGDDSEADDGMICVDLYVRDQPLSLPEWGMTSGVLFTFDSLPAFVGALAT